MKTKEEIEQLAEQYAKSFRLKISSSSWHEEKCDDFINGYTQCQEDMVDKKYTEEDMRRAYNKGCNTTMAEYEKVVPEHIKPMSFEQFIQSLNKQD